MFKEIKVDVNRIRRMYPKGTKVRLTEKMADPQSPPVGAIGTVKFVDDIGDIHVSWDTGGSLALIPIVDEFEIIK